MADEKSKGDGSATAAQMTPYEAAAVASHWLGLQPTEARILRDCLWARTKVPNGHFLVSGRSVPSARRLIARGYLAQAAQQPQPFDPKFGLVVVLEPAHWAKLIGDANATRTEAAANG